MNLAVVVCLGVFAAVWPRGIGLMGGEVQTRVEFLALVGYLWPLAPVTWLAALVAVAQPPGPTRLRRWPAYLGLGALGVVVGVRGAWPVGHLLATNASVRAFGVHAPAGAEARAWLLCTLSAAGVGVVASGVLVAAATRQYAAAERAVAISGRRGFSVAARTLASCAAAGALTTIVVSWLRTGLSLPASYEHALLFGTQNLVLGAVLSLLVSAGWLVPSLVFGLKMRRFPTAAWIAAGAAGVLLVLIELNAAVSAVRWYRSVLAQFAGDVPHPASTQHAAWGTLTAALTLYVVLALFGIALLIAAALQYRASRAPAAPAPARWWMAATATAVLAVVALTAPWVTPAIGGATTRTSDALVGRAPTPSPSAAPSGVDVTPAPTPGDGIPAVVGVIPLPGGLSGWSGDTVQVDLLPDGGETIDAPQCRVWVDGRLMVGVGSVTALTPGRITFWTSWTTPLQGSAHTFRVLIVTDAGRRLECSWRW